MSKDHAQVVDESTLFRLKKETINGSRKSLLKVIFRRNLIIFEVEYLLILIFSPSPLR